MVRADDVEGADGAGELWIVLADLVDHAQLDCQAAVRIGDYRIREFARDVWTIRFYILQPIPVNVYFF